MKAEVRVAIPMGSERHSMCLSFEKDARRHDGALIQVELGLKYFRNVTDRNSMPNRRAKQGRKDRV